MLAYHIIELFLASESVGFVKLISLFFLLKTKYGFNPYMQRIFNNTHNGIVDALTGSRMLLGAYLVLYKAINVVGKIYLPAAQPRRNVIILKKTE